MLKHTDDDGDLSVFASGSEVLFACSLGHYWIVQAQDSSPERGRQRGVAAPEADLERFGPAARRALGLT